MAELIDRVIEYNMDLYSAATEENVTWRLTQHDLQAHLFRVVVTLDGEDYALNGCTARIKFVRPDGVTIACTGTCSGNVAEVELQDECYELSGTFTLLFALIHTATATERTVLVVTGAIRSDGSEGGSTIDPSGALPSWEQIREFMDATADNIQLVQDCADAAAASASAAAASAASIATPIPVASGGTGATTVGGALATLGVRPQAYNLLDNSDFRNPVNQREIANSRSLGAYAYFIDRWVNVTEGNTCSIVSGTNLWVAGTFYQILDPARVPNGMVVTAAVKYLDGTIVLSKPWTVTRGTTYTSSGYQNTAGGGSRYVHIVDRGDSTVARVQLEGRSSIVWAALYEGEYTLETLPTYVSKGYAVELAECMRYYQRFPHQSMALTANVFSQSYINFRMPMRITPSVTISAYVDGTAWYVSDISSGAKVAAQSVNRTTYGFNLNTTSSGGLTVANRYACTIVASADL